MLSVVCGLLAKVWPGSLVDVKQLRPHSRSSEPESVSEQKPQGKCVHMNIRDTLDCKMISEHENSGFQLLRNF
jgi:hypothetical protein